MASPFFLYGVFYFVISICFIFPSSEFVSAGFTVECIFSSFLGSEHENFMLYHIRRTVTTLLCHAFLPLGFILGSCLLGYSNPIFILTEGGHMWKLFVIGAVLLPLIAIYMVWLWWRENWKYHPVSKTLVLFTESADWRTVASDINIEFRRVDTFYRDTSSLVKVVATDNWLIKVSPYKLDLAHQSDSALVLSSSDSHSLSIGGPGGAQFLNIDVISTRTGVNPFTIRLDALDFKDLQDKVSRPITVLQNITFHQTLNDRFLEAFREQVAENPEYTTNEELDLCIGCMQTTSNVKLRKLCVDLTPGEEPCTNCYCRPMWCIDCMGKWFASRQDQDHTETWMASKCTCPLCRSRFCMLDISLIQQAS
ncbi:E3 ubiquitin-protein ligase TM129 [Anabrus simplex]|uniref:E3 ubiquitin-protein ligase TM129 n=1 Tax=Anabrus simplex TaxID=316456 RepID=UPI0034DD7857